MGNFSLKKFVNTFLLFFVGIIGTIQNCWASSFGALPFDSTLTMLKDAISGPFLMAAAIIMMVITCLMLAFGEWGDGFKKLINIVMWLSIAFGVTTFITTMFGGGATF